ncbi:MAG: OsmC family protein [Acidimicrobiia bacterium]|nr:OsmC family protein [Acidimicrobiia bacterium]
MASAGVTKTTTIFHLDGKRFLGRTPDGQQLMIDGESYAKTGMNPMEVLLNALGACSAFDVVGMIRKRRLDLVAYRVELEGDRAHGTPSPYTEIRAVHYINAPGLKQVMAERFVDLATNKYCSVASSLTADIGFTVVLEHQSDDGDDQDGSGAPAGS